MKTLYAPTEQSVIIDRTELTEPVAAGNSKAMTFLNVEGFGAGVAASIGLHGNEGAELVRLSAGQIADLAMAHKAGEQVSSFRFDSRRLYGSATKAGTYALIETQTIKVDDPQGTRFEYLGSTYVWFKATYYDSISGDETAIGDSNAAAGDQSGRYATISAIRRRARLVGNPYIQDDRLETARTAAESEIDASVLKIYSLPLSEVPGIITEICELLAAGSVLWEEFGEEGDGHKMLGTARGMLKQIREGNMKLVIDGIELPKAASSSPSFYPNATSRDDRDDPTAARMPRNKTY